MARVAIIGAGSMVFTRQIVSDMLRMPEVAQGLSLSLVDLDSERLSTARRLCERLAKESGFDVKVSASTVLDEGLQDAQYVVNSIQVGGYPATLIDFRIPESYGLRQTIADTLGVGGISRALRTLPAVVTIGQAMERVVPNAILLNYTNPMAMVMHAVSKLTNVEGYGLCHSVPNSAHQLADYLGVAPSRLTYEATGVNHQAWFLRLEIDGEDAYPRLAEAMRRPEIWRRDPVRFELFSKFGKFVSESSEHNAEYVGYFLHFDDEIQRLSIPVGDYLHRSEEGLQEYDELKEILDKRPNEPLTIPASGEFAPVIIRALVSGQPADVYVNVENEGLVINLPGDSCVEVPAHVEHGRVLPQPAGPLPVHLAAMNHIACSIQALVLEALTTHSREPVYEAALLDPNASATLTMDRIVRMMDDLIDAHGDRIPHLERRQAWSISRPDRPAAAASA